MLSAGKYDLRKTAFDRYEPYQQVAHVGCPEAERRVQAINSDSDEQGRYCRLTIFGTPKGTALRRIERDHAVRVLSFEIR